MNKASLEGTVISQRYRIVTRLGTGGLSTVYEAIDTVNQMPVAVKVLHDTPSPQFTYLFKREAQVLSKLNHKNINRVFEVGEWEGLTYIVIELLKGDTLASYLRKNSGLIDIPFILYIIESICNALSYIHGMGLIHLDIKPGNIILSENGTIYLTDFQISRITQSEPSLFVIGTPKYMSPEQILGKKLTAQSDIYSFGLVIYEMLTGGSFPHILLGSKQMREATLYSPPLPPSHYNKRLSPEIDECVLKCLKKDAGERFRTVEELQSSFHQVLGLENLKWKARENLDEIRRFEEEESTEIGDHEFERVEINSSNQTLFNRTLINRLKDSFIKLKVKQEKKRNLDENEVTGSLLAELDPTLQGSITNLIGREIELRIKDRLVNFGGGKFLLRGFGRYGATSLVEKIIQFAKFDWAKSGNKSNFIVAIKLDLTNIRETTDAISSFLQEIRLEDLPIKLLPGIHRRIKKIKENQLADVIQSSGETTFSLTIRPISLLEASFSKHGQTAKKTDSSKAAEQAIVDLIDLFFGGVKPLSRVIDPIVNQPYSVSTLRSRVIFVLDKVSNFEQLKLLQMMHVFKDNRVTIFILTRQEDFDTWPNDAEIFLERENYFSDYVPVLWEEEHNLIAKVLEELLDVPHNIKHDMSKPEPLRKSDLSTNQPHNALNAEISLDDFKDHLAYITKGAPGAVVKQILNHEYTRYDQGFPRIDLATIRNPEKIKLNAIRQRALVRNWKRILVPGFFINNEDIDRAKIGCYETLNWIQNNGTFSLREILNSSKELFPIISKSRYYREETIKSLLNVLEQEEIIERQDDEDYKVALLQE